ncbi:MAG: NAD(P)-dependent oxidoreductase [Alphaproteobacteria bacterium]|nr:NAD(P)-dependent oxidoreductase [Alphaproteobacteria bacterium]
MAGHLTNRYNVKVFNRTINKSQKWIQEFNGQISNSINEVVKNADVVITCLLDDQSLQETIFQPQKTIFDFMKSNSIFIDHTTASYSLTCKLAKLAEQKKIIIFDAPTSGGKIGAEKGNLSIMVGGNQNKFNFIKPILSCYAHSISFIGKNGSGQLAKIANQICVAGIFQGLAEAIHFIKKTGLDGKIVIEALSQGAAQSWQMNHRAMQMLTEKFDIQATVDMFLKDLRICLKESENFNLKLPMTQSTEKYFHLLHENGWGYDDCATLIRLFDQHLIP